MCMARGSVGGERGKWMRLSGLGFTNPVGRGGVLDMCLCFGCGGVGGEWVAGLDQGREWCYVCVSLDSRCRWQVQVSVYCAWRIPAHLRCTQCSILLHLMDICFLTCICLWQISQIQTSPTFVSSRASHPAWPKNGKSAPNGGWEHNLHSTLSPLWQLNHL